MPGVLCGHDVDPMSPCPSSQSSQDRTRALWASWARGAVLGLCECLGGSAGKVPPARGLSSSHVPWRGPLGSPGGAGVLQRGRHCRGKPGHYPELFYLPVKTQVRLVPAPPPQGGAAMPLSLSPDPSLMPNHPLQKQRAVAARPSPEPGPYLMSQGKESCPFPVGCSLVSYERPSSVPEALKRAVEAPVSALASGRGSVCAPQHVPARSPLLLPCMWRCKTAAPQPATSAAFQHPVPTLCQAGRDLVTDAVSASARVCCVGAEEDPGGRAGSLLMQEQGRRRGRMFQERQQAGLPREWHRGESHLSTMRH